MKKVQQAILKEELAVLEHIRSLKNDGNNLRSVD